MFLGMLSISLSIIINFTLTPYITNTVGAEAYGFVSLSKTFISYANIFMVALNSYASRFLSVSYIKKNITDFRKYFSTVFIVDFIAGCFLLIIGSICIINIDNLLNISPNLVSHVKILFLLTFLSFFITSINTVYSASAYVTNHLDYANAIKLFAYFIEIITLIFCFFTFEPTISYVGIASISMAIFTLILSYTMTRKLIPEAKIEINKFSFTSLKNLIGNGIWNSINSLGNGLNSGLDLLVTNILLTSTTMGQISIAKTLSSIIFQLYDAISQCFYPSFLNIYASGNKTTMLNALKNSMRLCGLFTNVVLAGFCALGKEFLDLWIPTQNTTYIYTLVLLALLPALSEGCLYPAYYIYTITLRNKVPCVVTILGGIANVLGMIILLKTTSLGAYAILLTTAIIMNFINLVTNPLYMCRCLKIKKTSLYATLLTNIISCIITAIVLLSINKMFPPANSWVILFIKIILFAVVGVTIQIPLIYRNMILLFKERYKV